MSIHRSTVIVNVNIDRPAASVCVDVFCVMHYGYIEIRFNHWWIRRHGQCDLDTLPCVWLLLLIRLISKNFLQQLPKNPNREDFTDMISGGLHKQRKPFKHVVAATEAAIKELKSTIYIGKESGELEQNGHGDNLRIAGIPENKKTCWYKQIYTFPIALKVDRHIGSNAEMPVTFPSSTNIITPNLADSRLHETLR